MYICAYIYIYIYIHIYKFLSQEQVLEELVPARVLEDDAEILGSVLVPVVDWPDGPLAPSSTRLTSSRVTD